MRFKIKRIPVSEEEKRERLKFFMEDTGQKLDLDFFLEEDLYNEFIDFKCKKCGHEEELEADIVFELFDEEFEDYPILTCPKCGKETFIPKDICIELSKRNKNQ